MQIRHQHRVTKTAIGPRYYGSAHLAVVGTLAMVLGVSCLGCHSGPEEWPHCGDGELRDLEECDDGEENSSSLPDHCRKNCVLPHCGDDVVDSGEECELLAEHRLQCADLGFDRGWLTCSAACGHVSVECSTCGDGIAGGEASTAPGYEGCDGNDLRGQSCASLGRGTGQLACTASCTFDLSDCDDAAPSCRNGVVEETEECDDGGQC